MKEGELVHQRLRQKPQTRIGQNGLADDLKLSRFQLYRRVKAQSGLSPKQIAGKHRIEQACMLLRETRMSVSAISLEVGIDDPNYFTRFFKLQTGMSPRQWRALHPSQTPAPAVRPMKKAVAAPTKTTAPKLAPLVEPDLPVHLL